MPEEFLYIITDGNNVFKLSDIPLLLLPKLRLLPLLVVWVVLGVVEAIAIVVWPPPPFRGWIS
jgi:hypothetical protein